MLAGGVGLFIKTFLTTNCRDDMTTSMYEFKIIWVEIINNEEGWYVAGWPTHGLRAACSSLPGFPLNNMHNQGFF